jgi:hypothetical protein
MQNVYSIFLKDCTMTTVEPANPTKINLNKKRARFWNKADRLTYGRVTNSTLLTSGGNDTVSIDFLDNSLIDLGSGNDRIVISPYTRNFGFFQEIVFDGLGSNVTIDGGTGRDTLSIQAPQAGFQWAWDGAYWQIQQDGKTAATIKNIETVTFDHEDTSVAIKFARGTDRAEQIMVENTATIIHMVNAGSGNDRIIFSGLSESGKSCIDGGAGTDLLIIADGTQSDYRLSRFGKEGNWDDVWHLQKRDNTFLFERWMNVAELKNIENIQFSISRPKSISKIGESTLRPDPQSFKSIAQNNYFSAPAGDSHFDLSNGLRDTIAFNATNYKAGITHVTVKGMKVEDTIAFIDLFGCHVVKDTTVFSAGPSSVITGTQIVLWNNNAQLAINYTT